ncbi:MAG: response regulator transcription factor [Candidatus Hydrogenedentes bacterium]|nr:response regulator transcription factor [Candidatus Hydrogenedentota bacterium]
MRILLIEDDSKIASFITNGLKQEGFSVDHCKDGEEGYAFGSTRTYEAAIVDIMMPGMDGLTVIQRLRRENVSTPVLILSARRSVDDRVRGLQTGGDDYLIKPFAFSELLARVQALVRRAKGASEATFLQAGDLTLDVLKREVWRSGKRIDLQPREFSLLEFLMRNAERAVSKTMIMEHVWGYNFDPQTNVVEARISRLRDKIDKGFPVALIQTIRGVGYAIRTRP